MKALLSALILISAVSFTTPAKALLLEPLLTYENGFVDYEPVLGSGTTIGDNHSGMLFGGRVGTDILGLFYTALDVRSGSVDLATNGSGTRSVMGLVVGADLPLIRVWAGYNFQDDLKATFAGTERTIKGSSLKAGVGLGMIPFIEISAEYTMMSKGAEKDNYYGITVSAPFDL